MEQKDGINRRDFLKIGGITAGMLGAAGIVDLVTDGEVLATNDAGGFFIRHHDPDDPPYDVDESKYTKPIGSNTSFTRNPDEMQLRMENTTKNLEENHPGDDRLAYAYGAGAATFMFDMSMYSWDPSPAANMTQLPNTRWLPEENGYTVDEVTKVVKRSAKLYGASLVGITALDERWFYSDYADMNMGSLMGGGSPADMMTPEMMQQMLPQILGEMDPEDFKAMLLNAMENIDPEALPAGINPEMLESMSGEMLQTMMPQMMGNMDPTIMSSMMENIDPELMPDMSAMMAGGGMDMTAMMRSNAYEIVFSDDVDAPLCQEDGTKVIPRSMNRVIVMAFEMDEGGIQTQVSQLGDGATMNGYSRMAFTSACLANFLRNLGYNAIPMGNDHALSTPMAIDAGLGELGRNSMLITPKYGPRVRLAKVLTDLPLNIDRPISFGVTEFCEVCGKCAEYCPSSAIPEGERTYDGPESGNSGYYHWPVEGDKCFAEWARVGGSCYHCIRVCPFNKPEGWLHDATRILIGAKSGALDQLLLKLDDISGYGGEIGDPPEEFWDKDTYVHIKP